MANKKAWMTAFLFKEWFLNCFVPEVREYLRCKKLDFKVLLIVDNAPSHLVIEHPNIKVMFLPPNTTSLIQPLDQWIIAAFKAYYIKHSFKFILNKINNSDINITDAWKAFTIKDCINCINCGINELQKTTLNKCWKNLWKDVVLQNPEDEEGGLSTIADIFDIGNAIGSGFEDLSIDDINELFENEVIEDEEIFESIDLNKDDDE